MKNKKEHLLENILSVNTKYQIAYFTDNPICIHINLVALVTFTQVTVKSEGVLVCQNTNNDNY